MRKELKIVTCLQDGVPTEMVQWKGRLVGPVQYTDPVNNVPYTFKAISSGQLSPFIVRDRGVKSVISLAPNLEYVDPRGITIYTSFSLPKHKEYQDNKDDEIQNAGQIVNQTPRVRPRGANHNKWKKKIEASRRNGNHHEQ